MKPRRSPSSQRSITLFVLCALCVLRGSFLSVVRAQAPPKQAVVETSAGTFVLDLDPSAAPNQTAYFMKLAADGAYDGTTFHRVVKYGMVQGGDPLTKDPAKRALYGTGGQNAVKAEARAAKMTRGSVAAGGGSRQPGSAGPPVFFFPPRPPAGAQQKTGVAPPPGRGRGGEEDF